jgi:hypothetical protein
MSISGRRVEIILNIGESTDPWDVSAYLPGDQAIEITRDPVDFETPPIVNCSITIAGNGLSQPLNPRLNYARFAPGNYVTIRVANSAGTFIAPPFGGRLRIWSFEYNDGRADKTYLERITLQLTDELGFARRLEPAATFPITGAVLGDPRTAQTTLNAMLNTAALTLGPQAGDPTLTVEMDFDATKENYSAVVDTAHLFAMSNSTLANQCWGLWVDTLGRLRLFRLNTAPTTFLLNYADLTGLVRYESFPGEKQQLPQIVRTVVTGERVRSQGGEDGEDTDPTTKILTQNDAKGLARITEISTNGENGTKRVRARFDLVFPPKEQNDAKGKVKLTGLIDAEYEEYTSSPTSKTREQKLPIGKIDKLQSGFLSGNNLVPSRETTVTITSSSGVVRKRQTLNTTAAGLLQQENPDEEASVSGVVKNASALQLLAESSIIEEWTGTSPNTKYFRHESDFAGRSISEMITGGSESEPPRSEKPASSGTTFIREPAESSYDLYPLYPGGVQMNGLRVFTAGKSVTSGAVPILGRVFSQMLFADWFAMEIEFPILEVDWPPAAAIAVARGDGTSDVYISSGDVITLSSARCSCETTGRWVGTRPTGGGDVTAGVTFQTGYVQQSDGNYLLLSDGSALTLTGA